MIRRNSDSAWLLIPQIEHARIAAELAHAWGNDRIAPLPLSEWLLPAIRHHDDGWQSWDTTPHIDPDCGRPRDFTEMPMADSTAIWSRSIAVCSRSSGRSDTGSECLKRLTAWLATRNRPLTHQHEQVLAHLLEATAPLTEQLLADALRDTTDDTPDSLPASAVLDDLLQAGIVAASPRNAETGYQLAEELREPSPFGGLWVSGHFCDLAHRARQNRTAPADLQAIDRFLDEQTQQQAEWRQQLAAHIPDNELASLIELGLRYIQRFDRLSLWLCCAERHEPFDLAFPGAGQIHFVPMPSGQVIVEPWPFAASSIELATPAVRIPRKTYASDSALHAEMATAQRTVLRWVLLSGK